MGAKPLLPLLGEACAVGCCPRTPAGQRLLKLCHLGRLPCQMRATGSYPQLSMARFSAY